MRKLPKPTLTSKEVFLTTISKVRNRDLKLRLNSCETEIITDTLEYNSKASRAELHKIQVKDLVNNIVTVKEMEAVYTDRLAKKGQPGRKYYDTLKKAPSIHNKCPFCAQRPISTLDHYLPKSKYPSLAVSPTNLVPACSDCNKIKNASVPNKSEEEALHPYFDNIETEQWLYARVDHTLPVSLEYYIKSPPNATTVQVSRVKFHFEQYKLAELYASEAASELSDIVYRIKILFNNGGPLEVKEHLQENAISFAHNHINSWKTAMYQALADDEWFYSEWPIYIK